MGTVLIFVGFEYRKYEAGLPDGPLVPEAGPVAYTHVLAVATLGYLIIAGCFIFVYIYDGHTHHAFEFSLIGIGALLNATTGIMTVMYYYIYNGNTINICCAMLMIVNACLMSGDLVILTLQ